jgi:hypothetical protein
MIPFFKIFKPQDKFDIICGYIITSLLTLLNITGIIEAVIIASTILYIIATKTLHSIEIIQLEGIYLVVVALMLACLWSVFKMWNNVDELHTIKSN